MGPAASLQTAMAAITQRTASMISRLLVAAGAVALVAGVIFALQGFGVLGGSVMSGSSLWAALGPIIALAGLLALLAGAWRLRSSGGTRG